VELYNDTQPYTSFNTSFHGLDEYVEYSVRILGTTIKGEGPKSAPVTCRTDEDGTCGNDGSQPVHVFHSSEVTPELEGFMNVFYFCTVPHATPQDLNGFNTSDTTIQIFWQELPLDDRNGIITGYTIFFNTTLRNGRNRNRERRVGNALQTELTSLFPFKYYDIQVAAWTSKGMGPKCNVTTILTEEEGMFYFIIAPTSIDLLVNCCRFSFSSQNSSKSRDCFQYEFNVNTTDVEAHPPGTGGRNSTRL
jgi:hypothetical protein